MTPKEVSLGKILPINIYVNFFLNKVGGKLYYIALEKEKNRFLKPFWKKLNLLKMEIKDKTGWKTIYFIYILFIHSTSITWHLLLFLCWENKDERDLLPASSFLRKKYYTNKDLNALS